MDLSSSSTPRLPRKKSLFAAPTESSKYDSSAPQSPVLASPVPRSSRLSLANKTPTGSGLRLRQSGVQTPPSISETFPFDWEAARSNAPPARTAKHSRSSRLSMASDGDSPPGKKERIVRKAGFFERLVISLRECLFSLSCHHSDCPRFLRVSRLRYRCSRIICRFHIPPL